MKYDSNHFQTDGTECSSPKSCPFSACHSRLQEAHRQFHDAEVNYFDPAAFTSYLNVCVQSLRNVTWVLQKRKSMILGFDDWYGPWQNHLKKDPVLKWLTEARNKIVKESDLDTESVALVSFVDSYSRLVGVQIPLSPFHSDESLAAMLIKISPKRLQNSGFLRIERRWIANDLPKWELLNVLAHAYAILAFLIRDAHNPIKKAPVRTTIPSSWPGQVIACMSAPIESRLSFYRIEDGNKLIPRAQNVEIDRQATEEAAKRYGPLGQPPTVSPKDQEHFIPFCRELFQIARTIMEKDEYHESFAFIINDQGGQIMRIQARDNTDKLLLFRRIANEVEQLRAYAVAHIGECWQARNDPQYPNRSATESPNREEILQLSAVSSWGEQINLSARVYRTSDGLILGATEESTNMDLCFFSPVIDVWNRMFVRANASPIGLRPHVDEV